MHVDVADRRCNVTFKLIHVRQVIRPMTSETSRTAEGSDENVRNVIRHCLEFAIPRVLGCEMTSCFGELKIPIANADILYRK